jgi:hypothetical protein
MEAARARFSDEFTARTVADYPTMAIAYENRTFIQPVNKIWAKFNVMETSRVRADMSGKKTRFVRVRGMIVIEVFAPAASGTGELYRIMDKMSQYLEEKSYPLGTGRTVTTLVARRAYAESREGFARGTIMTPYWLDEALPVTA